MMMIRASVALAMIVGNLAASIGVDAVVPESKTLLRGQERALNSPTAKVTALELINTLTHTAMMSLVNGTIVDIATIPGMTAPSFSIVAQVEGTGIKSVGFQLDKLHVEKIAPYALCANKGNVFNTCPQLMLGTHTLSAAAYPCLHARCPPTAPPMTITFTIINSQLVAPPPSAPTGAAAAPVAAPIVAPITDAPVTHAPVTQAPATQAPVTHAPVTHAPVTQAPVTQAPVTQVPVTQAPVTQAPVTHAPVTQAPVTQAPVTQAPATQAPVAKAPISKAPATQAPTTETAFPTGAPFVTVTHESACDTKTTTLSYILCVSLGDHVPTLTGSAPEDQALQWLIQNESMPSAPDGDWRLRLRQQYALLSLGFQPTSSGTNWSTVNGWSLDSTTNECEWDPLTIVCARGLVTRFTLYPADPTVLSSSVGTIPANLGLLTSLSRFEMADLDLTGSLPSTIGLLANIARFDVGSNLLAGTIPSGISSWTKINVAKFENNYFNGTMPTFQNFCPLRDGTTIPMKVLSADCSTEGPFVGRQRTTKPAEIVCACCRCFGGRDSKDNGDDDESDEDEEESAGNP